jgi:ABC-type branched-subunit amino acid transport system ATPase component
MSEHILDANGLHSYYGVSHILHGVDFTVKKGETIGLMGRNGMGKTTLIKSMLGLVRPRQGAVRVRGVDMTNAARASPTCPKAAASSPTSRCARTSSWPLAPASMAGAIGISIE